MKQLQLTEPSQENGVDAALLESKRVPLERKVVLKFHHFGGFFIEYSANISLTGMFIKTEAPKPPGSVFIFEIWLGDEYRLVHGLGEVIWVRHTEEGRDRPPGMGIRYLKLGGESRAVVERVIAEQVQKGGDVFDLALGEAHGSSGQIRSEQGSIADRDANSPSQGDLLVFDEKLLAGSVRDAISEGDGVLAQESRPDISSLPRRRGLRVALLLVVLAAIMGGTAYLFSAGLLPF